MEGQPGGRDGPDGVSYSLVSPRLHPALIVLLVVAICTGLVFGLAYWKLSRSASPGGLLAHLPAEEGVILAIDFAALRQIGLLEALASSSVAQEPEYRSFLTETGFDYNQDLDYAVAWFHGETTCVLLRGRFDWGRLKAYAVSQGGTCRSAFCRLQGSTPNRKISFFPLSTDVMALAVSPDEWAANGLARDVPQRRGMAIPPQPVWLLLPASRLRSAESLPAGTRLFAKAMEGTDKVVLSLAGREELEIQLEATCHSAREASVLAFQLDGVTRLLREMIAKEGREPNPRDFSGVLAAGSFNATDQRVLGRWPVGREFLQSILEDSR